LRKARNLEDQIATFFYVAQEGSLDPVFSHHEEVEQVK
jgi:hypothetical protein